MIGKISFLILVLMQIKTLASEFVLPSVKVSSELQQMVWDRYCVGNRYSTDIPVPNYNNSDVFKAVKKLSMVSPYSFYFYSGPLYAYNLKVNKELVDVPPQFPKEVPQVKNGHKNAHAFLTLLCGEFRDRPTLIQDKINWIQKMYLLPDEPQKSVNLNSELWPQFSARSYKTYLQSSRKLFDAKLLYYRSQNFKAHVGQTEQDYPIPPMSICETKFVFKKYVENGIYFGQENEASANKALAESPENYEKIYTEMMMKSVKDYMTEYNKFKSRCEKNDLDYFYDFRGDSNFKPNSPESNGMIWFSSTVGNLCTRVNNKMVLKESVKDKVSDPEICTKYFSQPFAYRWSAARAGLATWLMRSEKHDEIFANTSSAVNIIPSFDVTKPFGFKTPLSDDDLYIPEISQNSKGEYISWNDNGDEVVMTQEQVDKEKIEIEKKKVELEAKRKQADNVKFDFLTEWENQKSEFWKRSDLGFNVITGLGTKKVNRDMAFARLRDAVNRHTDWYASGYEDGFNPAKGQAYSPFVASSYEMSASDGFTSPGVTVQSPNDGCKHWMFVFKLKLDKWYSTLSIEQKKKVNFDDNWFDETSLGTNGLADSERALDRLGTALEGEMDSILYLHNIDNGHNVNVKCGAEYME